MEGVWFCVYKKRERESENVTAAWALDRWDGWWSVSRSAKGGDKFPAYHTDRVQCANTHTRSIFLVRLNSNGHNLIMAPLHPPCS